MIESLTSLAALTEAISRVMTRHQVDPAPIFRAAGLDPDAHRDPNKRVPLATARKIWGRCVRATNDPCIGFEVGMAIVPANLHAVGYALMASRTLREGLERMARYFRVISTAARARIEANGDEVSLTLDSDLAWPREGLDGYSTAVVAVCRAISHDDFAPRRVDMLCPEPPCAAELARYFACPIRYRVERQRHVFDRASLDAPLPRQNPAMAQASDEVALRYIAHMDREDVINRAKVGIIDMLSNGEPNRAALADRLHMSERTLTRRLDEKSLTFRALLDAIRRDLALGYAAQSDYSVTEITYLLGFSDVSNFARSFRRWTGRSPSQYRAAQRPNA